MIEWYTSKSKDFLNVTRLCESAESDDRTAAINMSLCDWKNQSHTLMYKLRVEKIYDTGGYGLYMKDGVPVAGSGYYVSDLNEHVFSTATRAYTVEGVKDNFNYIQGKIWHDQLDILRKTNCKIALMSFNEYNKGLVEKSIKINDPANWSTSFCENGIWYRKPGKRIQPLKAVPFPVYFNYVKQYIIYTVFDKDFEKEFLNILTRHHAVG